MPKARSLKAVLACTGISAATHMQAHVYAQEVLDKTKICACIYTSELASNLPQRTPCATRKFTRNASHSGICGARRAKHGGTRARTDHARGCEPAGENPARGWADGTHESRRARARGVQHSRASPLALLGLAARGDEPSPSRSPKQSSLVPRSGRSQALRCISTRSRRSCRRPGLSSGRHRAK